ncbi:MAG: hypothetical protein AB7P78_20000 [Candidatus Binatia bacterium]
MTADGGRYCICKTFDDKKVVYTATRVIGPGKAQWLAQGYAEIGDNQQCASIVTWLKAKCMEDRDGIQRA